MSHGFYRSLVDRYDRLKWELGEAENTIRRLTGREPDDVANAVCGTAKFRPSSSSVPRRSYSSRKKSYISSKRKADIISIDDDSPDDDDESPSKKPALQSTVVAKSKEGRSRKATIEEQNANSKIKARNRRMFGALIGTLEKFQDEEKKRQGKVNESLRAEIEQKVEAATEEERERIKKEKQELFLTRREKQTQLRCLEKKIERAESHEVFDSNHKYMSNFIMTKSKPPIFFLPASHTSTTKKCLEESRSKIKELIKQRKELLEGDLAEIEEWYRKDTQPVDKENKCPKDESESQDVPETESESLVVEQEDTGPDDEDSATEKHLGSLTDQDFEPIYD